MSLYHPWHYSPTGQAFTVDIYSVAGAGAGDGDGDAGGAAVCNDSDLGGHKA